MLRNVTIESGNGNDTVRTPGAGDIVIRLGDGNDVAYVDNSGAQYGLIAGTGAITNVNSYVPGFGPASAENAMFVFNTDDQTAAALAAPRNRNNMLSDTNDNSAGANNGSLFRAKVTVTYKGLTADATLPADVYRPTDLHVNQAIKAAINNNAVLSKLLVAEDGPGYSLVVKSLIDGAHVLGNLGVVLTAATAADFTLAVVQAAMAVLDPADNTPTAAELQTLLNNGKANFDAKGDYVTAFAHDTAVDIAGGNSFTPSDNTITPGVGDDVVVLGTTSAAAALESSNDTVVYSGTFGNDVVVYFQAGAAATGGDKLNFTALGYTSATGTFDAAWGAAAPAANSTATANNALFGRIEDNNTDTVAEIAGLFINDAANTTAKTWVYVAINAANAGKVYQLVDGIGATGVTATLMGSIDLADTPWGTLVVGNFS
jgi:hypothetical protein